jgi:hypothetical protein
MITASSVERLIDSHRRKYQLNSWPQSVMPQIKQLSRQKLSAPLPNDMLPNKPQSKPLLRSMPLNRLKRRG